MTTRTISDYFQGVSGQPPSGARVDIELAGPALKEGVSVLAVASIALTVAGGDINADTGYWEAAVIDSDTTGQAIRVRESVNGASVRSNAYEVAAGSGTLDLRTLTPVTAARPYTPILTDRSHRQDAGSSYWGHPSATLDTAGFLSAEDKARLNDLWAGATPSYVYTPDLPDSVGRSISAKMNEAVSVKDWNVAGSDQRTTGGMTAGSAVLTLASAMDFRNGQGITVFGAGPAASLSTPGAPSIATEGATGSTTYKYKVVALDGNWGHTPASAEGTVATGNAVLSETNYNKVTIATVPGAEMYAIYGDRGDGVFRLLTILHVSAYNYATTWNDTGAAAQNPPGFLPATAPATASAGVLSSTIVAGGGTTSLTLAGVAASTVAGANVHHDDTDAFQKALDAVYGAGGGVLFVPPGTYRVHNLVLRDRVTLVGAGRSSILKLRENATNWSQVIITGGNESCKDGVIADLTFDGSHDVLTWSNIQMHGVDVRSGSEGVTIRDCFFLNICGDGIRTSKDGWAEPDYPTNTRLVGCRFENMGRQDIAIVHGYDVLIDSCVGDGHLDIEPEALSYHIVVANCDFDVLAVNNFGTDNRIDCTIVGSRFRTGTLWNCAGLVFTGNVIGYLRISSVKDMVISGNVMRLLDLWPASTNHNVTVTGNVIRNVTETTPAKDPLDSFGDFRAGIVVYKTEDFVISDNIIIVEGKGASNTGSGIYMAGTNYRGIIKGNRIISVENAGATSNVSWGVYLLVTNQHMLIQGNSFNGQYYCVDVNGANCDFIQILDNYFLPDPASEAWTAVFLQNSSDVLVQGNTFAEGSGIYSYGGSGKRIRGNTFLNGVGEAYHINLSNTTVVMGRNFYRNPPGALFNSYLSTVTTEEPVLISGSVSGKPATNAIILSFVAPVAMKLMNGLPGSRARAGTAATAETIFVIGLNGSNLGTVTFAAAATTGTFALASDVDIAPGDLITIVAPGSQDATLADIGFSLLGV